MICVVFCYCYHFCGSFSHFFPYKFHHTHKHRARWTRQKKMPPIYIHCLHSLYELMFMSENCLHFLCVPSAAIIQRSFHWPVAVFDIQFTHRVRICLRMRRLRVPQLLSVCAAVELNSILNCSPNKHWLNVGVCVVRV